MKPSPETIELLLNRRSQLAARLVPPGPTDSELETILRCGTRVPDHKGLAPWRIHVLDRANQDKLHALLPELHDSDPASLEKTLSKEAKTAPLLLVVSSKIESAKAPRSEQILSCAAVCQNLIIAAAALGYRSQWLTEWFAYNSKVKALIGVPGTDELVGFIYVGSEEAPPKERPRPDLQNIVTHVDL